MIVRCPLWFRAITAHYLRLHWTCLQLVTRWHTVPYCGLSLNETGLVFTWRLDQYVLWRRPVRYLCSMCDGTAAVCETCGQSQLRLAHHQHYAFKACPTCGGRGTVGWCGAP